MAIALSQLQQEIIDEVRSKVSNGEAIVAASGMKILNEYAEEMQIGFLSLSTDGIELMFRKRGTSDVTKARQISTLWWIFEIARFRGLVLANPIEPIARPRVDKRRPDFQVDNAVVDSIIAHCASSLAAAASELRRARLLLRLALLYVVTFGGFLAEIEDVFADDICSDGLIVGRQTQRERKLRISADGVAALQDYRSTRTIGPDAPQPERLFANKHGDPLEIKLVWRHLREVIKAAGYDHRELSPAKLHRAPIGSIAESELGWEPAIAAGGYRHIPAVDKFYSPEKLAWYIDRFHPMNRQFADKASYAQ